MITCFSFKLNGWVNFGWPFPATPATITRGRAMPFQYMPGHFAYATKEAAEMLDTSQRAIPCAWAKMMPIIPEYD